MKKQLINDLMIYIYVVLNWFKVNSMVANAGKFQIRSKIDNSKITFAIENKQKKKKKNAKKK